MAEEAYECTLSGTLAGQFVQTVVHVAYNNTTSANPFDIAKEIRDVFMGLNEFINKFVVCLPASYTCTSVRVRRVGPSGGPTAIGLSGAMASNVGQRDSEISSAQVNPLVILVPTVAPSKTGRIFMPGVAESDIDGMVLVATLLTALQGLIDYMKAGTSIPSGQIVYGVYRRTLKLVDPLLDGYVSPLIGTQRRRLHPV